MRLTRATDYAVRVMMRLALKPRGGRMTQEELAEQARVPVQFLGKVMQSLVRAGLANSHRGVMGGFELTRPGTEITLLQIVEATDGPIHLDARFAVTPGERLPESIAADQVWRQAATAMTEVLRNASLADLALLAAAERPPGEPLHRVVSDGASPSERTTPPIIAFPVGLAATQ
ncbi:MAG: Rrf2 family transcriptional regulator [Acidobacteria bacterium]|nr:Rrf2 family transcriptional regulator [Acidobacteriota bacterium]